MVSLTRRDLVRKAGTALPLVVASGRARGAVPPRVVVIGGGAGGATVARYLAMAAKPIDITLIEPKKTYTTCFFSNLYLAGLRSFESITHTYDVLAERHGVRVVPDRAITIDPAAKTVVLAGGARLAYDRLVVAPGIAFQEGAIAGYDTSAMQVMPHAWMAGPQTVLLREQLEAMRDGGVFAIAAPADPFRCPPGPYERASAVAAYLKKNKPRSKILILDSKENFFEQEQFEAAWRHHYPGMIEWLPAQYIGKIESVDPGTRSVHASRETFAADVVNVIPPQRAADIAHLAGLTDPTGWCPIDPETFESTLAPGVHLVGDAINAGKMPKSAFAANSQAKACASAIASTLTGVPPSRPFLYNTCYTFMAADDVISDAISFRVSQGEISIAQIAISGVNETPEVRARTAREANDWYDAFTHDIFG